MKRWSAGKHSAGKRGTKQFGITVWGNSQRVGFQANVWRWEFQLMRERS